MKEFTENTPLYRVRHCKEFASMKDHLINPYSLRFLAQFSSLKTGRYVFANNLKDTARALNKMREMAREKTLVYRSLSHEATGYFAFLIGKDGPFVLVIPGGGYHDVCSMAEGFPVAVKLNELGYNAYVGLYRVGREARFPNPQDDVAEILKDIFERAEEDGVQTKGYALCGFSAGGHLAASMATKTVGLPAYGLPLPKTLLLGYPVVTMGTFTHKGSRNALLGKEKDNFKLQEKYSIERQVDESYPSTYLWQCIDDPAVPVENSKMLVEALRAHSVRYEYHPVEGKGHGWGLAIGTSAEGWLERAVAFWQESDCITE